MTYHPSLTGLDMPARIKRLPVDHRGFPVPRFVAWINGQPDHRVVDARRLEPAITKRECWICGEPLGRYFVSIIGCMCAVNRVISEPPSHRECAEFAVKACPFLARPHAHRREAGLPEQHTDAPGFGLKRNPGVTCLWISKTYPKPFRAYAGESGILFQLADPIETVWYRESRLASRGEVQDAIEHGLPALHESAAEEGEAALVELAKMVAAVEAVLPPAHPYPPSVAGIDMTAASYISVLLIKATKLCDGILPNTFPVDRATLKKLRAELGLADDAWPPPTVNGVRIYTLDY
jgi:hypothetical protein